MNMTFSKNIMISLVVHFICITALLMSGFNFSQTSSQTPHIKANEMVFTIETASAVAQPQNPEAQSKPTEPAIAHKAEPQNITPTEPEKIVIVKKAIEKVRKKPKKNAVKKTKPKVKTVIAKKAAPKKSVKKQKPQKTKTAYIANNNVSNHAKVGVPSQGAKKIAKAPSGSVSQGFSPKKYITQIKQRIAQHKHYPNSAKRRGIEGRVGLQLSVTANGTIKSLHIIQSSGSKALDKAAIKSVRNAMPFVKMAKSITFKFFMKFNLNER